LAENVHRAPLHPLDQFRAFQALRQKGQSEEEIAAAFFVGVNVVKQRLRLATVSEKLLDIYAEDGMSLEQLMAFTVTNDHKRQEQVWESLQRSYSQEPYQIRRLLTERTVRASDRRALFIGIEVYEKAGGIIMRDLFQQDALFCSMSSTAWARVIMVRASFVGHDHDIPAVSWRAVRGLLSFHTICLTYAPMCTRRRDGSDHACNATCQRSKHGECDGCLHGLQ
jgi:ParB-like chromosome segregation protein Spo0J